MNKIIPLFFLFIGYQFTFGQACGKYRLKYTGEIIVDSEEIINMKLPTTMFLHGLEDKDADLAFVETRPIDNKIDLEIYSHLTSVFTDEEILLNMYQKNTKSIPADIIINSNGVIKKINLSIPWSTIHLNVIEDNKFGTLFELDLNLIKIESKQKN